MSTTDHEGAPSKAAKPFGTPGSGSKATFRVPKATINAGSVGYIPQDEGRVEPSPAERRNTRAAVIAASMPRDRAEAIVRAGAASAAAAAADA